LASQADNQTTPINVSPENDFIFGRELEILQEDIPLNSFCIRRGKKLLMFQQQFKKILEAIINSNTKDRLIFILSEDEELICIVSNQF